MKKASEKNESRCPVCGNNTFSIYADSINGFQILLCKNCQNGFTSPIPTNPGDYYPDNY